MFARTCVVYTTQSYIRPQHLSIIIYFPHPFLSFVYHIRPDMFGVPQMFDALTLTHTFVSNTPSPWDYVADAPYVRARTLARSPWLRTRARGAGRPSDSLVLRIALHERNYVTCVSTTLVDAAHPYVVCMYNIHAPTVHTHVADAPYVRDVRNVADVPASPIMNHFGG